MRAARSLSVEDPSKRDQTERYQKEMSEKNPQLDPLPVDQLSSPQAKVTFYNGILFHKKNTNTLKIKLKTTTADTMPKSPTPPEGKKTAKLKSPANRLIQEEQAITKRVHSGEGEAEGHTHNPTTIFGFGKKGNRRHSLDNSELSYSQGSSITPGKGN